MHRAIPYEAFSVLSKSGTFFPNSRVPLIPYHEVNSDVKIAAIIPYSNLQLSTRRNRVMYDFMSYFNELGIESYVIELSNTDFFHIGWNLPSNFESIRIKAPEDSYIWNKENLINIALRRIPDKFTHVLWIDCDAVVLSQNYRDKIIEACRKYKVIQAWSKLIYINKDETLDLENPRVSYWFKRIKDLNNEEYMQAKQCEWSPGLAWVASIDFLEKIGGLYDRCIVGGGDMVFLRSLVPNSLGVNTIRHFSKALVKHTLEYTQIVQNALCTSEVGGVDEVMFHLYHGEKNNRRYGSRHAILSQSDYDPVNHVKYNSDGVLTWSANASFNLIDGVKEYILGRKEDE